jgi:hypothetical protein
VSRRTDASAPPPLEGRSLWLLPEDAPLRVRLYDAATSRGFDRLMSLCVLLNCAVMAYEHPGLDKRSVGGHIVYWRCVRGG